MPLDLNAAGLEELARTGISFERARFFLEYRDEHGYFRTWEDVKNVPGFSQKSIELLKEHGAFFSGHDRKAA
jgi:competence protein ComEA